MLGEINTYMCFVFNSPEDFPVLDEYLFGLKRAEFCKAFNRLKDIVMSIYKDMSINYQSVGLAEPGKKVSIHDEQTSQHTSCVIKFFYAIGKSAELTGNLLSAPMDFFMNMYMTYMNAYSSNSRDYGYIALQDTVKEFDTKRQGNFYKSRYIGLLFNYLNKFGFDIQTTNGSITMAYPDFPIITRIIKAFTKPLTCRNSFMLDYAKFNYRVFNHESAANIPLVDLHGFQILSDESKEFMLLLLKQINGLGTKYKILGNKWDPYLIPYGYAYKSKEKIRIHQSLDNIYSVSIGSDFTNPKQEKINAFIRSVPDEIGMNIDGHCFPCDKYDWEACHSRREFETNVGEIVLCRNMSRLNFPPTVNALPYIVTAINIL